MCFIVIIFYLLKELVPGKSRSKKKSTTATFWEGII
jgi:hypothetical protein